MIVLRTLKTMLQPQILQHRRISDFAKKTESQKEKDSQSSNKNSSKSSSSGKSNSNVVNNKRSSKPRGQIFPLVKYCTTTFRTSSSSSSSSSSSCSSSSSSRSPTPNAESIFPVALEQKFPPKKEGKKKAVERELQRDTGLKLAEEEGQGSTTAGGDEADEDDAKRKAKLQEKSSTESAAGRQVCRQRGTGKLHTDRRGDATIGLNRT